MTRTSENDIDEVLLRRARRSDPAAEARAAEDRAAQWNSSLRPNNAFEVWIVDQVAFESVRIDGCRRRDAALREADARKAADPAAWDLDRKAEAQALGAGLARNPALVMAKLRRTKHGCFFLGDRWDLLLRLADRKAAWNEAQRSLAMDLLGTPKELREGLDPLGLDGLEGDALAEAQRQLALRELKRVVHDVERSLDRRDADDRAMTADGVPPALSKALEQTRRYEAACQRRLNWALAQLKRKTRATGREDAGKSSPATATASDESDLRTIEEAMGAGAGFGAPEMGAGSTRLNRMMTGATPGGLREAAEPNGELLGRRRY